MASTTHAPFRNTSHPHIWEQKCDLSIKISSRTCRFETCRYLRVPSFQLRLISWERFTIVLLARTALLTLETSIHLCHDAPSHMSLKSGIAQMVERPTETPGARLTRVRFPVVARDSSSSISFECRLSYSVRTPSGAIACSYTRYVSSMNSFKTALRIPTQAAVPLSGHTKMLHTLVALLLRLLCLTEVRWSEFPAMGNAVFFYFYFLGGSS